MEDRSFYVYLHIRLDNNTTFYVGKGKGNRDLDIGRNKHHDNIRDYAVIRILDNLTEEESLFYEREIIERFVFECGYGIDIEGHDNYNHSLPHLTNCTWGGEGISGHKHTKEARKKMSEAKKGKHLSEETRQKMSEAISGENNPMYGKYCEDFMTSEAIKLRRQKMSENHADISGENNPMYNKHHSEESRTQQALTNMKKCGANHIKCIETGEIFINGKSAKGKYGGNPWRVADGETKSTGRRGQNKYTYEWIPVGAVPIENLIIIK